jgi:hypothetical protein
LGASGLVMMASRPAVRLSYVTVGILGTILFLIVGSALLQGRPWSRKLYLFVTPLLLGTDFILGNRGFEPGFSWWIFGVGVGQYIVWAFFRLLVDLCAGPCRS